MIDVVFLLIIFFMTTAQFARVTREEIDLPQEQGEQEENPDESGIIVNLTKDGRIIVSSEELDLRGLEDLVRDEVARTRGRDPGQLKLMLRADRNADTTQLNEVISTLRGLGVGAARVATEVPR